MSLRIVTMPDVEFANDDSVGNRLSNIATELPIVGFILQAEALQASGTGGTVVEDSGEKILREVRLLEGSDSLQHWGHGEDQAHAGVIIGGQALSYAELGLDEITDAATSGTPLVKQTTIIPCSVPWKLYRNTNLVNRSALRIGNSKATYGLEITFGAVNTAAHFVTGGSGYSFSAQRCRVSAIVDTALDRRYPKNAFDFRTKMQKIGPDTAAAKEEDDEDLPRNKRLFAEFLLYVNNGVRNTANLEELIWEIEQGQRLLKGRFDQLRRLSAGQQNLQITNPVGHLAIDWDYRHRGTNLLDASSSAGFQSLLTTVAAETTIAGLYRQAFFEDTRSVRTRL